MPRALRIQYGRCCDLIVWGHVPFEQRPIAQIPSTKHHRMLIVWSYFPDDLDRPSPIWIVDVTSEMPCAITASSSPYRRDATEGCNGGGDAADRQRWTQRAIVGGRAGHCCT